MKFLVNSLLLISAMATMMCCKQTPPAREARYSNEAQDPNALFKRLDKAQTGITFENDLKENNDINYLTYFYLYNGGGVATGDFNNDNLPDVYLSATMGENKLYLNKGNMQFEDVTEKAGVQAKGGFKSGVTLVDINNDGLLDIYQCRSGQTATDCNDLLYINKGNMTFEESAAKYGIQDQCATNSVNFFDFDHDGDLDFYMLNYPTDFNTVNSLRMQQELGGGVHRVTTPNNPFESDRFYQNNGNNTFTDISAKAGINNRAFGLSTAITDINHDGYMDIYVANDYAEPDMLYINNKNGTFSNQIEAYFKHFTNNSMGTDIADINNDGLVDVSSLDMLPEDNYYQKELMTSMRKDRYSSLVKYGYGKQLMRNMLHINNGNGTFSEIGKLSGVANTDWSWSILMADYDNDSWKDMFITNGYYRDFSNLDYVNFTMDSVRKVGSKSKDINDYLNLLPSHKVKNYMFRNKTDLTFENVATNWGFNDKTFSSGAAYADLDADGDLDLVINNQNELAYVYQNQTREQNKGNYLQISFSGAPNNTTGIGATALIRSGSNIQYQELSPTRGFFSSVEPILHYGLGQLSMVDEVQITWPDGKIQSITNVQGNQRLVAKYADAKIGAFPKATPSAAIFQDIAKGAGLDFMHHENEFDDFNREFLLPHKFSTQGPHISTADVNGDGFDDVFVGGAAGQAGVLYLQSKSSTFKASSSATFETDKGLEDVSSTFFDADGDKDLDLYVVSGGNEAPAGTAYYQDRLYINDGKGNFAKSTTALPALTNSESSVSAHDYDGDGDLDLFLGGKITPAAYPRTPNSTILQNNGGIFKDVTAQVAPDFAQVGMVSDLQWIDVDGDKKDELVAVGEWMPITIFRYDGTKFQNITSSLGLDQTNGWWNCVCAADFDHDGDLDLIVGNEGTNTRLSASEKEPLEVYAKDFDKNGSIDPLIACYLQGKSCPLVQKDDLMKQIPSLKKKFLHYYTYAIASITDLYDASELQSGIHLSANTLRTSYFENNGGKFILKPLPILAQISITNGVLCKDFNKDGNLDILLVGNSNYAEVETGPYDASNGCLLLGDGKGGFATALNRNIGLWANKEARDVLSITLANKKQAIVIANNNDKLQLYSF